MYNRYIPQSDGSYRRNRIPDAARQKPEPHTAPPAQRPCPPPPEPPAPPKQPCPPPPPAPPKDCKPERPHQQERQPTGMSGFLRQLLPKNLDTGDLLVVMLLLLVAGDCAEDRSNALLTLALYLFM